jgi:glyoxylase-like metal-dependent hydrolase (beta-lactamase superfamily II)
VTTLAAGLDYLDLAFLGLPRIIATAVLHGPSGVALLDPGPSTCLGTLRASLAARGIAPADVLAILLTHIHLDHAGATGSLVAEQPSIQVFVHERGAPHLVDPARLLDSARRLYGADMDRLWGPVLPVPAGNVRALSGGERVDAVGRSLEVAWTPGHASHHVSYFDAETRIAFVGDTAGIRRSSGPYVMPPTPPPDIDLGAWRASADRILAWQPDTLFLTHFGPHHGAVAHLQELMNRLDAWSRIARKILAAGGTDGEQLEEFVRQARVDLQRHVPPAEVEMYERAGRIDYSWLGLKRYWTRAARSSPS